MTHSQYGSSELQALIVARTVEKTRRIELIAHLREDANDHRQVAHDCDTNAEETLNWQHALRSEQAADMLEADELMRLANLDCIAWFDALREDYDKLEAAAQLALDALGTCRIMGADADGNYTREITPKVITNAIAALKEALS